MRIILCKWCKQPIERFFWIERWTHTGTSDSLCFVGGRHRDAEPEMLDVEGL